MKWHEVREMYPNQFVKFEIVEYHEDEKTKYVDEVAVIKAIKDGNGAPKEYNDEKASVHYEKLNKIKASLPKCPYCHSTSIKKISAASRTASVIGFGIFSKKIGKQWHCNDCGSDF